MRVCVSVCVCSCDHVYMGIHLQDMCGSQKVRSGVLLYLFLSYSLRQVSSLNLELTTVTGISNHQDAGVLLSPPPHRSITDTTYHLSSNKGAPYLNPEW